MPLPKYFTTVTPFSKYLAMALFIVLPFVGFYLGMSYQKKLQVAPPTLYTHPITPITTNTPSLSPTSSAHMQIFSLTPSQGPVQTTVTIHGVGFTPENNEVMFGPSSGYRQNGKAANVIANVGSTDGKTLQFTVPTNGPSGIICDKPTKPYHCIGISAMRYTHGTFDVSVENANGQSNTLPYTITSSSN